MPLPLIIKKHILNAALHTDFFPLIYPEWKHDIFDLFYSHWNHLGVLHNKKVKSKKEEKNPKITLKN